MANHQWMFVPYPPPPKSDKSNGDKEADTFHYITRRGDDPHPPLLKTDDHHRNVYPQPVPFMGPHYIPQANPQMQFAHMYPPQPYSHYPVYSQSQMYPYGYPSPAPSPYAPSGYYAHPGMTYAPPPVFIPAPKSDSRKKKKDKSSNDPAKHHVWYGRTAGEVARDEAVLASKSGANEIKEIKPAHAKPGDQFWVLDTDGSRYLRSFYEIENVHKPGKWFINPADGSMYYVKLDKTAEGDDGWA